MGRAKILVFNKKDLRNENRYKNISLVGNSLTKKTILNGIYNQIMIINR